LRQSLGPPYQHRGIANTAREALAAQNRFKREPSHFSVEVASLAVEVLPRAGRELSGEKIPILRAQYQTYRRWCRLQEHCSSSRGRKRTLRCSLALGTKCSNTLW